MSRGILSIISGFSGAGKGTIVRKLLERYDNYALSVSATTRTPREGETEGISYFFVSKDRFEEMIREDALLEYACYVDNYYGTPRAYVEEQLRGGRDVILEIEIQGAMKVKEKFPDALLIFVTPPSISILRERLIGRNTESMEVIENRLARAAEEAEGIEKYNYLLVNDDLEEAVEAAHQIIRTEHRNMNRNLAFVEQIQREAQELKK